MHIESIRLRNYKSFKDAGMNDMPGLCVVVGANGTGKSTLFGAFGFLQDCLLFDVRRALQQRGGLREVLSRGVDPADGVRIDIRFRLHQGAGEAQTVRKPSDEHPSGWCYRLHVGERKKGQPVVLQETLHCETGGQPWQMLDFREGIGRVADAAWAEGHADVPSAGEPLKVAPDALALSALGRFERYTAAHALHQAIENWHLSDLHVSAARGSKEAVGDGEHLSMHGDNLHRVARNLYEHHPAAFARILQRMRESVPGVTDVTPRLTEDGRLVLQFRDAAFQEAFSDRVVSDGTLKMFAYLVLLHDPRPHSLLCIEEPENRLYPSLLGELAEDFRAYAHRGGQVLVSTHSPDFLNAAELDEVFWLVKIDGFSRILRARDDAQVAAYMRDGDQMGYLWKQGFLAGADPKVPGYPG